MERLYREHQIGSILVEGGRHTHQQFIKADMWDECYQNISSNQLGKGIAAPLLSASSGSNLHLHNSFSDGADWIYHYRNG
jgi:riboflavin biosynthesis pyrimidine reductase